MTFSITDAPEYSTPAFTVADGWNMDVTFARYIAAGLNVYLNDPYRNAVDENDLRRAIVAFATWGAGGDWDTTAEDKDNLEWALAFFAENFTRLWS